MGQINVAKSPKTSAGLPVFMDRVHAQLAARGRPATGFVSAPEPRSIGLFARGRQLIAGNFLFSGHLIQAPGRSIWELGSDSRRVDAELHGFAWLDDLAAVGDAKARDRAQTWVKDWIEQAGNGEGAGWTPDLTGRRLIRWINHALFLLRGTDKEFADRYFRSLGHQTIYLSRRWKGAARGLPRFEAMTGLIYAGMSLVGLEGYVEQAVKALARDCQTEIDQQGGISTRNPEELLEVFTLLIWAATVLDEAGEEPPDALLSAIDRINPTLRALRHTDGGLARFHGGGRGLEGRLDHALSASGGRHMIKDGLHMGFARLTGGRTSLVIDASAPPSGPVSSEAHASTLAFEITSGRRPMIVNCGSGASFGGAWRRAGRATPSHTALSLVGYSSSRLGVSVKDEAEDAAWLTEVPTKIPFEFAQAEDGTHLEVAHDGYRRSHGLTHSRILDLTTDGRGLAGEDQLSTLNTADEHRFDRALNRTSLQGIEYAIRFHLHPEVDAVVDMGGTAVSLALKSGEIWVFRHDGSADLTLEPSVYLEKGRLKPRATLQVVLNGRAMAYATRVRWSLSKAHDTPNSVRDLVQDDLAAGDI